MFYISVFGLLGIWSRYFIDVYLSTKTDLFPIGTLCVNLVGCLIAGIVYALMVKHLEHQEMFLFILIGFCGGLTTFSGYCLQSLSMMSGDGELLKAFAYILLSPALGLIFILIGIKLTNTLSTALAS